MLPSLFISLLLLVTSGNAASVQYHCIDTQAHISKCVNNEEPSFSGNLVAYAKYANRINETGWAELEVVTNGQLDDHVQAYYAGFLEGFITSNLISSLSYNMLDDNQCSTFSDFIKKNINNTVSKALAHQQDPYWHEVGLTLLQISGMDDGYKKAVSKAYLTNPHFEIDPCGVILINLYTEFDDLKHLMKIKPTEFPETRCSAIIKVLGNGKDVAVAHNTWSNYKTMLRIVKKLTLNYSTSKAKSVAMSSYPGNVFSTDDFYITSANLVVQETTNEVFNNDLWKQVDPDSMVFEFVRNSVANRLATGGLEWAQIFEKHNSGTYNNQFMIVDYKKFEPNNIQDNFLVIIEQIPGLVVYKDKTDVLKKQTYWPSFNVPYYETIYKLSHYDKMFEKYGDYYSHDETARAQIFRRDHVNVHNMTTLYHLMRYNNFKNDPISKCNCTPPYTSEFSIAARNDLNDPNGKYPIHDFVFRPIGAIDAKMTSSKLAKNLEMIAVSGPTDEYLPPFSWTNTKIRGLRHVDQPMVWKFKPVITRWNSTNGLFPNFDFDF